MNDRYIKIAQNKSNILTDDEWRSYVLYYRNLESLEHYEQNIKQHREMQAAISDYYQQEISDRKPLCDRIWRHY